MTKITDSACYHECQSDSVVVTFGIEWVKVVIFIDAAITAIKWTILGAAGNQIDETNSEMEKIVK